MPPCIDPRPDVPDPSHTHHTVLKRIASRSQCAVLHGGVARRCWRRAGSVGTRVGCRRLHSLHDAHTRILVCTHPFLEKCSRVQSFESDSFESCHFHPRILLFSCRSLFEQPLKASDLRRCNALRPACYRFAAPSFACRTGHTNRSRKKAQSALQSAAGTAPVPASPYRSSSSFRGRAT